MASASIASASPPAVAAEPHAFGQIDNVIAAVSADKMGLVSGAVRLEGLLKEAGLLYEANLNARQVGFDPANRDGEGGNCQEVLALAEDIASVGWAWRETSHALCVEVVPGDSSVEAFNRQLCEGSGLAPIEPDSIHFGSLSCGHTNMGLRAIAAGVASDSPLLSEDGKLSLAKLERFDAEYAKAVRQGLYWKVLRHQVRSRFPAALKLLQAACSPGMLAAVLRDSRNSGTQQNHDLSNFHLEWSPAAASAGAS